MSSRLLLLEVEGSQGLCDSQIDRLPALSRPTYACALHSMRTLRFLLIVRRTPGPQGIDLQHRFSLLSAPTGIWSNQAHIGADFAGRLQDQLARRFAQRSIFRDSVPVRQPPLHVFMTVGSMRWATPQTGGRRETRDYWQVRHDENGALGFSRLTSDVMSPAEGS